MCNRKINAHFIYNLSTWVISVWEWQQYLVKHSVCKAKHLSKSIEPAVEKGKKTQQENQNTCKPKKKKKQQFIISSQEFIK